MGAKTQVSGSQGTAQADEDDVIATGPVSPCTDGKMAPTICDPYLQFKYAFYAL